MTYCRGSRHCDQPVVGKCLRERCGLPLCAKHVGWTVCGMTQRHAMTEAQLREQRARRHRGKHDADGHAQATVELWNEIKTRALQGQSAVTIARELQVHEATVRSALRRMRMPLPLSFQKAKLSIVDKPAGGRRGAA